MKNSPTFLIVAVCTVFAIIASACDDTSFSSEVVAAEVHPIDPTFREFFDRLGGEGILGPAITPFFADQNVYYQYTVAGLMVHDPSESAAQRFSLAPLGLDMGVAEPPVAPPEVPDQRYVEGHIIFPLFVPLYEQLGGARFAGVPLTEIHYNPEKKRYEQYFANLGLYWIEGTPLDDIHLLAYGIWKCDVYCRAPIFENATVVPPKQISEHFVETIWRLNAAFTGYAISDVYQTPDGYVEQVFENVVLDVDPRQPGRVFLRAMVTERLGYRPDPLVEANPTQDYHFYPVQGDRGYNIHARVYDYIIQHGGFEVSGAPIGEIAHESDDVFQQCFTNLCVQVLLDATGKITVRTAPYGYKYIHLPTQALSQAEAQQPILPQIEPAVEEVPAQSQEQLAPVEPVVEPVINQPASQLLVQLWESYPMVAPNQSQEIGVSVFDNGQPVINVEPDLVITLPDGSTKSYYMYPTGSDGMTRLLIDLIDAPSGTLIPYQVCLYGLGSQPLCKEDSFLIWINP